MKKLLLLTGILLFSTASFAYPNEQETVNHVYRAAEHQATVQQMGLKLLKAAQNGQMRKFRTLLAQADKASLLVTDDYGRNILHVARNKQIFGFVWSMLRPAERKVLLLQRNNTGETPLMAHIVYGHEDIFLTYFPQTELYQRLQKTTAGLSGTGLARQTAEIEKAELIKECSIGGMTMWQRANALTVGAYGDSYAAASRDSMKRVRDMIGAVAPFLIK